MAGAADPDAPTSAPEEATESIPRIDHKRI